MVLRSDGRGLGAVTPDRGALRGCRATGWSIHDIGLRTKLPPNEFTRLILKGRGPRGGPYDRGGPLAPIAAKLYRLGTVTPRHYGSLQQRNPKQPMAL
jgi:hypothetical protein